MVGIHFEVAGMYTGTVIRDLMAAVEWAEQKVEQEREAEEHEINRIYALQVPVTQDDLVLMGAA